MLRSVLFTVMYLAVRQAVAMPYNGGTSARTLTVEIAPQFDGQPLLLSTRDYISKQGDTLRIDRFRFYLSSVQLLFKDGTVFSEQESYHLIDAEDENSLQFSLTGIPKGKLSAIRFSIGVDSMRCVSGVFGGDLDPVKGMYWAWNSGYIHAKLEGTSPSCATYHHAFEFHVGGFAYPENAIRTVTVPVHTDSDHIVLSADASSWLNDIRLAETNSVVIPGKAAMQVADNYANMFKQLSE